MIYFIRRYGGKLMEAKTPKDFFENVLPARFDSSKAAGVDAVVQLNITGDNGGDWYIIIKNQKLEVKTGIYENPVITAKMKDTDYVDMVNGKITGDRAYMTGKLRFKGNISVGMKLKGLGIL
jgi:putative sterol carrier protein